MVLWETHTRKNVFTKMSEPANAPACEALESHVDGEGHMQSTPLSQLWHLGTRTCTARHAEQLYMSWCVSVI